jgi:hypothetical protein
MRFEPKMIVIACNTASSVALPVLTAAYGPVPVVVGKQLLGHRDHPGALPHQEADGANQVVEAPVVLGLLLGTIGLDNLTAAPRFTFGSPELSGGLSFAALAIGLFGLSEILLNLEKTEMIRAIQPKLRDLIPRWNDVRDSAPAIGRGSVIGFIFGIIPGVSHVVSTFVSYAVEKRLETS